MLDRYICYNSFAILFNCYNGFSSYFPTNLCNISGFMVIGLKKSVYIEYLYSFDN